MKHRFFGQLKSKKPGEIQSLIMIVFSVISISIMLILGIVMYNRFAALTKEETIQSAQQLMEQTEENLEDYLNSMRQISDAAYYNVVKESDFSQQKNEIQKGMNLLYEANRENLQSIAIYNNYGSLMAAEPSASQQGDPNVTKQDWYVQAMAEIENMHFTTPHIQNLFDDASFRYYWVISLSRVVDLTDNGVSQLGVLLVDMDFSGISRMMKQINTLDSEEYYYLCDGNGEIIYHPRQMQLINQIGSEASREAAQHKDGVYDETYQGERRKVVVNTISYTGWKLVGVIPYAKFTSGLLDLRYFIAMIMILMAMMLTIVNHIVAVRIASPILKLNESVMEYKAGEKPEIYIGGPQEIRYLGQSIQSSYEQIEKLMKEIVLEQNERRKSELDALQSQINPHFLYNTLDSITWMIEGERNEEAVSMISDLAKLFRISLSKGRTVISLEDELQHAKSYMNIQKIRYKDAFSIVFDVDPSLLPYCAPKLILQPILENAITYGVDGMDDCGEICVTGRKEGGDILLSVEDNGMGMPQEEAAMVLEESGRVRKRGSGVGLVNVNRRIQILFGKKYGLVVESEPDEGTIVTIRIPAVAYNEENRNILEKGYLFSKEEMAVKNEEQ